MNILQTIESDLAAVGGWLEQEAEAAAALLWGDLKDVVTAIKPLVYAELRKVIVGVLVAYEGKDLAAIETALLNVLQLAGSDLKAEAEALGTALLQKIIAQVQAKG